MLFNSYAFIYVFLPAVIAGFFIAAGVSRRAAMNLLLAASIVFYGWWDVRYLPLLCGSIVFNYFAGAAISGLPRHRGPLLTIAITANLCLLGWYKYADFIGHSVSALAGSKWAELDLVLPLGISFFTFTQIAFLVDVSRGAVREYHLGHYALFVTYFPHLIAGPILHHNEMMPQFAKTSFGGPVFRDIGAGLMLFFIGLLKKVLLADSFQPYVGPVFDAYPDVPLSFDEAWGGALAYTFQIYFDFSGYSDMAVGLSRMVGIALPLNFDSPYKAENIIDFWRRWHMTLSRFLRDYLYIPLGGSRKGQVRRYVNLMLTMLLGGLWHGANWTFVVWGGLHGFYLVVNHAWNRWSHAAHSARMSSSRRMVGRLLTFAAVVVAWTFFRAGDFEGASRVLRSMFGACGLSVPTALAALGPEMWDTLGIRLNSHSLYADGSRVWGLLISGFAIVWGMPNSQTLCGRAEKVFMVHRRKPGTAAKVPEMAVGMLLMGVLFLTAVAESRGVSEFIYFNF